MFSYWDSENQTEMTLQIEALRYEEFAYWGDSYMTVKATPIYNSVDDEETAIPQSFSLSSIFPNPFNSKAEIQFDLARSGVISIDLMNTSGQTIRSLATGFHGTGTHIIPLNGKNLSTGIYFVRLAFENQHRIERLILLK